jgi:hypothetical protein
MKEVVTKVAMNVATNSEGLSLKTKPFSFLLKKDCSLNELSFNKVSGGKCELKPRF